MSNISCPMIAPRYPELTMISNRWQRSTKLDLAVPRPRTYGHRQTAHLFTQKAPIAMNTMIVRDTCRSVKLQRTTRDRPNNRIRMSPALATTLTTYHLTNRATNTALTQRTRLTPKSTERAWPSTPKTLPCTSSTALNGTSSTLIALFERLKGTKTTYALLDGYQEMNAVTELRLMTSTNARRNTILAAPHSLSRSGKTGT